MAAADDDHEAEPVSDPTADAERRRFAAIMAALGGNHTVDDVPDDVTPYRTEDGGWSTRALDRYLDGQLGGPGGARPGREGSGSAG
jgi:hypothetical protein